MLDHEEENKDVVPSLIVNQENEQPMIIEEQPLVWSLIMYINNNNAQNNDKARILSFVSSKHNSN